MIPRLVAALCRGLFFFSIKNIYKNKDSRIFNLYNIYNINYNTNSNIFNINNDIFNINNNIKLV